MIASIMSLSLSLMGPIRSSLEVYSKNVIPREPILVKIERENTGERDLICDTGDGDQEWLQVSLDDSTSRKIIPIKYTRVKPSLVSEPGEFDSVIGKGTFLGGGKNDVSFRSFVTPKSLLPGRYSIVFSWKYAYRSTKEDLVLGRNGLEEGMRTLDINVVPGGLDAMSSAADILERRVRDQDWKGDVTDGFDTAAADALFSMDPKAAIGAWRRLAAAPRRVEINGLIQDFPFDFFIFETLANREEPEAVDTLALAASTVKRINPSQWLRDKLYYDKAFRKWSESDFPIVAASAQKALSSLP